MISTRVTGIVSALAACGAIWGAACGSGGRTGPSPANLSATSSSAESVALAASSEPSTAQAATKDEIESVTGMIDHHLVAVLIGESCLEKAVHEELRGLCESLVAAEGDEVQALQSRQERYRVTHEPEMTPGVERQVDRLSALSGAGFELELLEEMSRQHQQGVSEASACVERTRDPELARLCREIGSSQLAAATHAQTWLCSWYGRC